MQRISKEQMARNLNHAIRANVGIQGLNTLIYGWLCHRRYGHKYRHALHKRDFFYITEVHDLSQYAGYDLAQKAPEWHLWGHLFGALTFLHYFCIGIKKNAQKRWAIVPYLSRRSLVSEPCCARRRCINDLWRIEKRKGKGDSYVATLLTIQ